MINTVIRAYENACILSKNLISSGGVLYLVYTQSKTIEKKDRYKISIQLQFTFTQILESKRNNP